MQRMLSSLLLTVATLLQGAAPTPAAAAEALLAADRGFSERAARVGLVDGLTPMFAADVIVPGPPARLYRGLGEVTALLRDSPDAAAHAAWTPIRVGLSGDGEQGFTFGFMTLTHPDGRTVPLKYMSYWVKGPQGWRVVGYKRARRAEGDAATAMMSPHLPAALVAPRPERVHLEALSQSLVRAERAFSDEAQTAGLGPAFARTGHATAVNMGGPASAGFVVGAEAIGAAVGGGRPPGPPSPVEWSSEVAMVASSGDLGVSFGFIRPNGPAPPGAPAGGSPFFTIWSRPSPAAPWRYIAE